MTSAPIWIMLIAIASKAFAPQEPATATCYSEPERIADVTDPQIDEASGLIASRRHQNFYYTHNDSGGQPFVFALDRSGRTRAIIELSNAQNQDWEDISIAPGASAGNFDIVVADIGDNAKKRSGVCLYRFEEPKDFAAASAPASAPARIRITAQTFRVQYDDGPHNAESLAVHPFTGDAYIIVKREDGRGDVYAIRAPWHADRVNKAVKTATLRFPAAPPIQTIATAADISPDGRRLAVRSYLCGWEWTLPPATEPREFESVFTREPTRIELAAEPQGEAIAYSPDGRCLLTISEHSPTRLFEICRSP